MKRKLHYNDENRKVSVYADTEEESSVEEVKEDPNRKAKSRSTTSHLVMHKRIHISNHSLRVRFDATTAGPPSFQRDFGKRREHSPCPISSSASTAYSPSSTSGPATSADPHSSSLSTSRPHMYVPWVLKSEQWREGFIFHRQIPNHRHW